MIIVAQAQLAPLLIANDDSATTNEDNPVTIDVKSNDNFSGSGMFTVTSVSQPSNGEAVINSDNTVTYTPNQNFFGSDSFQYTVSDSSGLTQDSATVFVTVNPVNDTPVANDDSVTTDEDTHVTIDVLANDSDIDGDSLSIVSVTEGTDGSVQTNQDNTVTYTPNQDFFGSDSFTYTISDSNGGSDSATVSVTVNQINDAPNATDDTAESEQNTPVVVDVLTNDSDPDGDALIIVSTSTPSNGTATINSDNTISYSPNQGFVGDDSFTYTVSDGNGGSDTAMVFVTVTQGSSQTLSTITLDSAPHAVEINTVTNKIYATHYSAERVSVIDGSSDTVTSTIFTGSLTRPAGVGANSNTNIIYVGDAYHRSVLVIDGATDTVISNITGVPDPLQVVVNPATNKIYTTGSSGSYVIDGSTNTPKRLDGCGSGNEFAVNPVTNIVYQTCAQQAWRDFPGRLSVLVIDGASDAFIERIDLRDGVAGGGHIAVNSNTNAIYVTDFFSNTVFVIDGDTNTPVSQVPIGTTSVEATKDIAVNEITNMIYVTKRGDDIVSTIDGETNQVIDTISADEPYSVNVNPETNKVYVSYTFDNIITVFQGKERSTINIPPNASDDSAQTNMNTAVTIDVVANDIDSDGDALSVISASTPANGAAMINADNTITYSPNQDFTGNDSFTYTISDSNGGTDTATVVVTINSVNASPTALDDSAVTDQDTPVTIDVLANDSDPDGDVLSIASVTQGANGSVQVNQDNTVTYMPNQGLSGSDSFSYTVSDGNGGSDSATVSVMVNQAPNNDSPWSFLGQNQQNTWYSPQTIINSSNVGTLQQVWSITIPYITGTPVVSDGIVYATSAHVTEMHGQYVGSIYAINKTTGNLIWEAGQNAQTGLGFSTIAGIAINNGNIYAATIDSDLVSLDAVSGTLNWKVPINEGLEVNPEATYVGPQGTPLVWDDKIFISNVLGNSVARGFVRAFSESDGSLLWTFYTVPSSPMSSANQLFYQNSWGDCTYCGGGDNWNVPAIDPSTGIMYFGTGNPTPYFNGDERSPNPEQYPNLYANSVIALNATNGQMIWYYQQVKGDTHNWDVGMPVQIFNTTINGEDRKVVGSGGKNGYYYLFDAATGELIYSTSLGIHLNENQRPTPEGEITYPGTMGGVNTYYTYNPNTNSVYIISFDVPTNYQKGSIGLDGPGGSDSGVPGVEPSSTLYSIDASTGIINWSVEMSGLGGGVSSTNNLVFTADAEGIYYAFDAQSGEVLWTYASGKTGWLLSNWGPPSVTGGLLFQTSFTENGGVMAFAPSSSTTPPPSSEVSLTVTTESMSGNTIEGLWVQLFQNGEQIDAGYSPVTFTLKSNQLYTVAPNDYSTNSFDHWSDTGSTTRARNISISSDTTITAVYRTLS